MISKLMERKGRWLWAVQVFLLPLVMALLMLLGDARISWSHDSNHSHYGQGWAGSSATDGLHITQNKSGSSNSALYGNNNEAGVWVCADGRTSATVYMVPRAA